MKKYTYIVYLTTNTVNKKIYIGVHGTTTPEKFDGYYGCGISRGYTLKNPKTAFLYALKKYGYDSFVRSTIKEFDNYEDAYALEAELVNEEFIKRTDTYNMILGGGEMPNSSKRVYQYDLNGTFIKEFNSVKNAAKELEVSPTTISQAAVHYTTAAKCLWSFEKVEQLNLEDFTVYNPEKHLFIYDSDGNFIKEFQTFSSFCKEYNTSVSHINRAIKLKYKISGYYLSDIKIDKFITAEQCPKLTGNVHLYDLNGNYIKSYNSIKEVEKEFNLNMQGINPSIKQGKPYKNFLWLRGVKQDFVKPIKITKGVPKKVGRYSLEGELLEVFDSVRKARIQYPSAEKVIKGIQTHCKGYLFKYIS